MSVELYRLIPWHTPPEDVMVAGWSIAPTVRGWDKHGPDFLLLRGGKGMMTRCVIVLCSIGLLALGGCAQNRYRHPSADLYLEKANEALEQKNCWEAQKLLRNLLSDFPGSHLVDRAQYKLGFAFLCDKDYVTAVFEFERLLNEFPTSPFVDQARYQIGVCYYRQSRGIHHDQDETHKAIREFERFIEDFPDSDLVPSTRDRILELRTKLAQKKLMVARNYIRWDMFESAARYCEIVLKEFKDTPLVAQARFLLARTRHQLGALDEALEMLRLLAADGVQDELKREIAEEIRRIEKTRAGQKTEHRKPAAKTNGSSAASSR